MKRVKRDLLYNSNTSINKSTSHITKSNINNYQKRKNSQNIEQYYKIPTNGIIDSNGFSYHHNTMNNHHDMSTKSLLIYEKANKLDSELSKKNQNLNMILNELQLITRKLKSDEEDEQKSLDWKFAAMVIDRLCFFLFSIATFISTVVILLTANNFFKFT